MDSKQALGLLGEMNTSIKCLLYKTQPEWGEVDENIKYQDTADERLLGNEIYRILDKLSDIKDRIEYLQKPVRAQGTLRKNSMNYYEMITSTGEVAKTYHAGNRIEALINDNDEETWHISRVEHNGDYYVVGYSGVKMEGLKVRER